MSMLGHNFHDPDMLTHALTHRSSLQEAGGSYSQSNELLEFLGDAVLGFIVVDYLYRSFPTRHEGELSKLKSILVSGKILHQVAREIKLGDYIILSHNEARNGGRDRASILEDSMEAVIAVLYLDGGFETARKFIYKWILSDVEEQIEGKFDDNFKSQLLEYAQGLGILSPVYKVVNEDGPEHRKRFEIEVCIDGRMLGIGYGRSKKAAQQQAARMAMERLTCHETELDYTEDN